MKLAFRCFYCYQFWIHFLNIGVLVGGVGFYLCNNQHWRKKNIVKIKYTSKNRFNFVLGLIPCLNFLTDFSIGTFHLFQMRIGGVSGVHRLLRKVGFKPVILESDELNIMERGYRSDEGDNVTVIQVPQLLSTYKQYIDGVLQKHFLSLKQWEILLLVWIKIKEGW